MADPIYKVLSEVEHIIASINRRVIFIYLTFLASVHETQNILTTLNTFLTNLLVMYGIFTRESTCGMYVTKKRTIVVKNSEDSNQIYL